MRTQNLTLAQEVELIKNGKGSKNAKREALIKLGLRANEVAYVLATIPTTTRTKRSELFTFGVEIECFVAQSSIHAAANNNNLPYRYEGYNHRDNNSYYKFVSDASVQGLPDPIECVSPVLKGKQGLKSLEACCKSLNDADARVNKSCGLHVHIGAADLTGVQYANVFANYQMLESVIDSFMANSRRGNNSRWAKSLNNYNFTDCFNVFDIRTTLNADRYHKVNCESFARHKTIEFRQHQGSTDYKKISMWVTFCAKLVAFSKNTRLSAAINSIDEIPFLTAAEKRFFNQRKEALSNL